MSKRTLSEISREIRQNWKPVHPAAKPYLEAMGVVASTDKNYPYGAETASDLVTYFLSNASQWKGEVARKVKKELKEWNS